MPVHYIKSATFPVKEKGYPIKSETLEAPPSAKTAYTVTSKKLGRPKGSGKPKAIQPLIPGSLVRLATVLQHIPISPSSWYNGQKEGKYPEGQLLSERTRVYKSDDIIALLEKMGG